MSPVCELLTWDTEFFGRRIARIVGGRIDESRAGEVIAWCCRERIDCLYFLADAADMGSVTTAENHGFGMKDVRLTYKRRLTSYQEQSPLQPGPGVRIRDLRPEDGAALEALSEGSYTESRFYCDSRFSRHSVSLLYKLWIRKCVQGDADRVWVLEWDGRPMGFITCHIPDERTGQVQLAGLHSELRGKGLGQLLYQTALRWFADQGVETVIYVTQARNISAQRLIQRLGFLSDSTQIWFHKWFDEPVAGAA